MLPDNFVWEEGTSFWKSISKTDGWHAELTESNKYVTAAWITDAIEFVHAANILRAALGHRCHDGDFVSDVSSEKLTVKELKTQMEEDWGHAPQHLVDAHTEMARPGIQNATPQPVPDVNDTRCGWVHAEETNLVVEDESDESDDSSQANLATSDCCREQSEGINSDPYEGTASWKAQTHVLPSMPRPQAKLYEEISRAMTIELRHKMTRRDSDYS